MRQSYFTLLLVTGWLLFLGLIDPPKPIYDIVVNNFEGKAINMAQFKGKKLVIITMAASTSDSVLFTDLRVFRQKYPGVSILLVPSYEDGYKKADRSLLKKQTGLVITEPAYTRKAAGSDQSRLLQWLTHKDQNGHFDYDVTSPGYKFFVNETGELYAFAEARQLLTGAIIERVLTGKRPDSTKRTLSNSN